jgi:hypothetical protein
MSDTANAAHPDDNFHVVAISNHDHLAGKPDPVAVFFEAAIKHGEDLVSQGFRRPEVIQIPIEVYSLSFTHKDDFPKYGVVNEPPNSGIDLMYMSIYFFSDQAFAMAQSLGVRLPRVVKTITRKELPEQKGSQAPLGAKFWDRAS